MMKLRARMHGRVLIIAAALVAATAIPAAAAAAHSAAAPARSAVPHYQHIAVVFDNSHSFDSIIGNPFAPTINKLARQYGLATHYFTTSDPDVADILAMLTGKTYPVSDGLPYWDQQLKVPSLLSQLDAAHLTWKEYAQSMPYPGYLGDCYPTQCVITDTLYNQTQFNSVPDLASVSGDPAEAAKMVPAAQLATDAKSGKLPDFSLIDPNECADMHGGPPWCEDSPNSYHQTNDNDLVSAGDSFIKQVTQEIMSGPQWLHGNNAIVVTFTEGNGSAGCCDAAPGTGRVVTVVITSHGPRHLVDPRAFNHYSLLSTIQQALGLGCLNFTCDTKNVVPMGKLFGATSDGPAHFPGRASAAAGAVRHMAVRPTAARHAGAAAPVAVATGAKWHQVPTPNIGTNDNVLAAIAGSSPSDIWAVGSVLPTSNATIVRPLAVHYNGTAWSAVPTPQAGPEASSFYGVTALPDGTAWAVGIHTQNSGHTAVPLAEHWNGQQWSIVRSPHPGLSDNMLYGVAGISDSDVWAAGTYSGADGAFHPLLEHWNGRSWSVTRVPALAGTDGMLTSVTARPGQGAWATGQLAMGTPDQQVVLHLVGSTWKVVPEPAVHTPGGALASAYPQAIGLAADGLWVAGNDRAGDTGFSTLAEAPGAGGRLREQVTPNPTPQDNYLFGVAPASGGHAWAVGYSIPATTGNANSLIEYGSASGGWKIVPSPNPGAANGGNTFLTGALAFGPHNVWAVGTYDGSGGMRTFATHYTG